jgi:uncharacterized membrane protein
VVSLTFLAVIQEVKTLDVQLEVANRLGFNVDTDKIYFGAIPPGNSGERRAIIENKEYERSVVRLKVYGELKKWITVSENNFALKKGESKTVKVKVAIPEGAELKDYESEIIILFARF